MLGAIIACPEPASDFLLSLGDLRPGAPPDDRLWTAYVAETRQRSSELADLLARLSPKPESATWTREPFRHWALEVSRYSFATGEQVFARSRDVAS